MQRLITPLLALVMLVTLWVPSAWGAGLLISIGELEQSGGSGSFEVLLTNTEPSLGATYKVAGFSFELLAAPGSGIMFTAADYPSSGPVPYIFDGTGQTTLDPTIPLSEDGFATTNFSGADSEFTYASIGVAPGDIFALGLISFTATSTVVLGDLQGLFVSSGTTLSDENFQPIAYSLAGTSVPEPSSLVMATVGSALGLIIAMARRTGISSNGV